MKLSEMKEILAGGEIRLTKSLGQNFLHDQNQLRRIIAAAELKRTDRVLEVGPGLGPLTELLLLEAGEVLAIEMDGRLVEFLKNKFGSTHNLDLRHDDALRFLQSEPRDWSDWKLVSNLPYSVASPVLVELAQARGCPARMVATVQLEVAQRIESPPDAEHYGVLTLLLQLRYEPQGWFKIPASCFFPAPEVDSACIVLERRGEPLLSPEAAQVFTKIVKRAFSQRRKMMFKLLKADWPETKLATAFEELKISRQTRAEQQDLKSFVALTKMLLG